MSYTTPPGSGNAYSRDFVQGAYAMAAPTMRWSDDVLVILAPILGDVLTIRKPLARYRVHGANDGAMQSLDAAKFRNRLHQDVEMARLFATVTGQLRLSVPRDPLDRSLNHLQYRFASYLVEPSDHPFPDDTIPNLVRRLLSAAAMSSQMRLRERGILITWTIGCALAPRRYRRNLILWRFAPTSRPPVIRTLLRVLSSLRSTLLPNDAGSAHLRTDNAGPRIRS